MGQAGFNLSTHDTMTTDQQVHDHITAQEELAEKQLGQEVTVAYRPNCVSVSGWVGDRYEVATGSGFNKAVAEFRKIQDTFDPGPAELRRMAAEYLAKADAKEGGDLLAKADAMEAGK